MEPTKHRHCLVCMHVQEQIHEFFGGYNKNKIGFLARQITE